MVEMEVQESAYINGKYCYAKNIRHFKIMSEGVYVNAKDFNQQPVRKLEMSVEFDDANIKKTKKWQPNKKAERMLETLFGKETKNFIGKILKINLEPYQNSYTISIDELDTKKLNGIA